MRYGVYLSVMKSMFDDRPPPRVRVHMLLDPDQAANLRRIAQRAGAGVTLAQVCRAVVREGLVVVDRKMREEGK